MMNGKNEKCHLIGNKGMKLGSGSKVVTFTRGMIMAYKDIYNGLTDKEKEKMLKADIPKFRVVGDANLSKEELEQAERGNIK